MMEFSITNYRITLKQTLVTEANHFLDKYFSVALHLISRIEKKSANGRDGKVRIFIEVWTKDFRTFKLHFDNSDSLN